MIIRARTFRRWMLANHDKATLHDIATKVDAGWYGLTYYTDTCKLYNRFKHEIWEALLDDAESSGENVFKMIAEFGRSDVGNVDHFENLLTWYMAERIAREEERH